MLATLVALAMLLGMAVGAKADTRTKISDAEARLQALEHRIASQQASIGSVHAALLAAAARVGESSRQLDVIQVQLIQSRRDRERVNARYEAVRAQIDSLAVRLYTLGPPGGLDTLDPRSVNDVSDAMQYAVAIVRHDSQLADEATVLAAEVKQRLKDEQAVELQRAAVLSRLTDDQDALARRFADEQNRLAQLADARAQVSTLLAQLRKQLRAEEIAAAEAALAGGISFGKWATVFLGRLSDQISRNNLVVIVAWETAEYTSARWNPLATTFPMPGATSYNSSGVRNYVSLDQGLDATVKTLSRSGFGYESILSNLKQSADPMTTAKAINASSWCGGCANGQYVVDLVPAVERYYDSYASQHA
ncbi:MAG: hypothetical protein ACXVQX_12420 [Actinomycetota bacterium]